MATATERLTAVEQRLDQVEARMLAVESRAGDLLDRTRQVRLVIARFQADAEVSDLEERGRTLADELERLIADVQNTPTRFEGDASGS